MGMKFRNRVPHHHIFWSEIGSGFAEPCRTPPPKILGPVVREPINANPRLKVNQGFHIARLKWFESLFEANVKEKS